MHRGEKRKLQLKKGERKEKKGGSIPKKKFNLSLSQHLHSQELVKTGASWIRAALTPQRHLILTSDLHMPLAYKEKESKRI